MKPKILIASLLTFLAVFGIATLAQADRARYSRLLSLLHDSSAPLENLSVETNRISERASDYDLRFTAEYFATLLSFSKNIGLQRVPETRNTGNLELLYKSLESTIEKPANGATAIGQYVWLNFHKDDFERAARGADERLGGFDFGGIGLGCLAGMAIFVILSIREKPKRPVLKAAPVPISEAAVSAEESAPNLEGIDKY